MMEARSTNQVGYGHLQGDIISNVASSHGVQLTSDSTFAIVRPFSDNANPWLLLEGKGTGRVTVANSSQTIALASTGTIVGYGSTTNLRAFQRYRVDWTVPALSSATTVESTVTVTGLTTNSILLLQPRLQLNSSVVGITAQARCSTADELVILSQNISQSSISGSTQSAYLFQISF